VENVTDRVSNPFGMRIPSDGPVVYGYGDANADIHIIGDHPGVHGGVASGVPFTGTKSGRQLRAVLANVGLLTDPESTRPEVRSLYFSYLYPALPEGSLTDADYDQSEAFIDAEVRAITAHVLVPVGERALRYVLEHYTAVTTTGMTVEEAHAREFGTGAFLVVPTVEPATWTTDQRLALEKRLATVLGRDFRRESDLGRFLVGPDPYYVR
jgi:uracil-DNA glycosylase family 4